MTDSILVLNAGSSSIKFQLFAVEGGVLQRRLKGQIEGIGAQPHFTAKDSEGVRLIEQSYAPDEVADVPSAMAILNRWLEERLAGARPMAVGHRVVHGGPNFDAPVLVDDGVLAELENYVPLAPLHQPNNLAPIKAIRERWPGMPQVACFDTAFHRGHGELADRFAIPEALYQEGVRRYGFHGLSYEYIAQALLQVAPEVADGRVIVAHLGSGASLCALKAGRSLDSTMGFTALDGLPMGTRPGALDSGVVLYLIGHKGMDAAELEHLLYHGSGLKGLSGVSNDVRDLLASEAPGAKLALDYFAYRAAKEMGALASVLGGLDAIVFTAGIGENAPEIRESICERMAWLGITLDEAANAEGATRISRGDSRPLVLVIPTDEERMIAEHTLDCTELREAE